MNSSSFQCHTVWSKRVENATFFLLSSHPRFYRSWNLSLLWLLGILSQRREKVCAIFKCLFFWGVHFTASGVLEHVMNAVSVCITETQSLSCVLYTFCIMGLNFHLSKKWYELLTSCNVLVCKPDISETSKSEPVYALLAIISSEHTQQRIWNLLHLHTAGSYSSLSVCSLGIHSTSSLLFLTVFITNSNTWWISAYFFLPFTCHSIVFVYLKWPAYMWTAQQRKHPADSRKHNTYVVAWFLATNTVWMRSALFGILRSVDW